MPERSKTLISSRPMLRAILTVVAAFSPPGRFQRCPLLSLFSRSRWQAGRPFGDALPCAAPRRSTTSTKPFSPPSIATTNTFIRSTFRGRCEGPGRASGRRGIYRSVRGRRSRSVRRRRPECRQGEDRIARLAAETGLFLSVRLRRRMVARDHGGADRRPGGEGQVSAWWRSTASRRRSIRTSINTVQWSNRASTFNRLAAGCLCTLCRVVGVVLSHVDK